MCNATHPDFAGSKCSRDGAHRFHMDMERRLLWDNTDPAPKPICSECGLEVDELTESYTTNDEGETIGHTACLEGKDGAYDRREDSKYWMEGF